MALIVFEVTGNYTLKTGNRKSSGGEGKKKKKKIKKYPSLKIKCKNNRL